MHWNIGRSVIILKKRGAGVWFQGSAKNFKLTPETRSLTPVFNGGYYGFR
jgi:hypothetical protein